MISLSTNKFKFTFNIFVSILLGLFTLNSLVQLAEAHPNIPAAGNLIIWKNLSVSSTMSSYYSRMNVLDGIDSTRWESLNKDNQWLRVDLGSAQPIGKVSILWMASTTKSYELQVSDNGNSWTTAATGNPNGTATQLIEHNLTVTKRYVRILTKTRYSNHSGHSIRELGIYAPAMTPTPTATLTPTGTPTPTALPTIIPTNIPTNIPTLTPEPTVTPIASQGAENNFVTVCGMKLCLNGQPFTIHGATAYGQFDNPQETITLAKLAGLNMLELVEYEKNWRDLSSTLSEETWVRNDRFIAEAKANNIKIVLHFSSYGHALAAAGQKPTTTDWNPFLNFVMNRVNTVTGIKYADEPAIAKIQLYGEIAAPNYNDPMRGTTAETTEFYKRTLAQLKSLDSKHIISTGGFSYLNDPHSGIDWQTIMGDPNNAICDVEINSYGDRNVTVPNVSNYCKNINKPWFLSAWSSCQGTAHFSDDINHWPTDAEMAIHALDMYKVARNENPISPGPAITAVGSNFWNLGNTPARVDNCDIGPQYLQSLNIVQSYSPQ